jgi:hypothetical protein
MKTEFNESDYGLEIDITPETVEEVAMLFRFAKNANSQKPDVWMNFEKKVHCSLWLHKRKLSVQSNSIRPTTK